MTSPVKPNTPVRTDRYVVILEPVGNSAAVWDELMDEPAMLGGFVLIGLPKLKAEAACGILNRIDRKQFGKVSARFMKEG